MEGTTLINRIASAVSLGALLLSAAAGANYEFAQGGSIGGLELNWTNRFAAGVAMRTQSRDYRLVDKQNNPANRRIYQEGYLYQARDIDPTSPTYNQNVLFESPAGFYRLCERPDGAWQQYHASFGLGQNWQPGQNAPGSFTAEGDCTSQFGNPFPSQQLINAPGGYMINSDDGNLNYDKGDVTYANLRLRSELTGGWRNFSFKVGGIAYHDPVNDPSNHPRRSTGFETHLAKDPQIELGGRTYTIGDPRSRFLNYWIANGFTAVPHSTETTVIDRSGRATRPDHVSTLFTDARVLEAYVSGVFDVGGRDLQVTVGNQYLRWGESTFTIFNTLNQVNPLSAILYRQPGSEVRDGFLPVGLITANLPVTDRFGFEVFYQYDWRATEPDICGSFLSTSDVAGCGRGDTPIYLGMGNVPENPAGDFGMGGIGGTQTATNRRAMLLDEKHGYPQNGKQFGLRLDYYSDLFGGTEVSLYGMNIHSRLPYYSVYAACRMQYWTEGEECPAARASDIVPPDQLANFYPEGTVLPPFYDVVYGQYPADTLQPFLDYPEDIRIFGLSGTTTLGDWSFAGEISYSPNQPAQVSVVDVTYAGVQPAFFDVRIGDPSASIGPWDDRMDIWRNMANMSPQNRIAVPDYLVSRYRSGAGDDWEAEAAAAAAIQPGQYIPGFERLKVGQLAMTGIRIFSGSNPLAADQIMFVGEMAAIRVFDMPPLDQLQFQGSGAKQTHYSQGQAEYDPELHAPAFVGTNPNSNLHWNRRIGPTDRFNPERADPRTFANDFAWGYRIRLEATYNDLIWGTGFRPRVQLYHDVQGTSISPGQDFVHGRKEWTLQNEFIFNNAFSAIARYVIFHGAGDRNLRGDRDYAEVSFTYAF
jgi:hypothetical protein